jgi:hypothetical protein
VLKGLRDGQPPEVRQRIDQILASYASPSRPAPQPRPAPPGGGRKRRFGLF